MNAESGSATSPAAAVRRRRRYRRLPWLLVCAALALLALKPLLLAGLPPFSKKYVNGRVTAQDIEWLPAGGFVALGGVEVTDTTGANLLAAERVTLGLALNPLRLATVTVDSAAIQVNLADYAFALRCLLKESAATDTAPARLPDTITVNARADLRQDTWTRAIGIRAELRGSDGPVSFRTELTDLTGQLGHLRAAGGWNAATSALSELKLDGDLRGESSTLLLAAAADYSTGNGLVLHRAMVSDGIDTIAAHGGWQPDSAALTLLARDFTFAARYPQIPWAHGELLDLSLRGNRQRIIVAADYRAGRVTCTVRGELEPEQRRARVERADGWHPALGAFAARGDLWQDSATGGWRGAGLTLSASRFPLALDNASASWQPDSGALTLSAQRFRYERYVLEHPAGAAVWHDDVLTVQQLTAGGLDGELSARGSSNLVPARGDIVVSAKKLRLAAIDRMFRREFADNCTLTDGTIDGEVGVHWGGAWKVTVKKIQLARAALRVASGQMTNLAAEGELTIDGRALTFDRLACRGLGGTLGVQGELSWSGASTLTLTAHEIALPQVDALLRATLAEQQLALSAGTGSAVATVRFGTGPWSVSAPAITIAGATVQYAPLGSCREVGVHTGLDLAANRWTVHNLRGTMLGGTVTADGTLNNSGTGLLQVAAADIKLAELDSLLRTKLAKQQLRLLNGNLAMTLAISNKADVWHVATTQPLTMSGVRLWQQQAGTLEGLGLILEGDAGPGLLTVKQAIATLPSGEVRGRAKLAGDNYSIVQDGELTFTGLHLAEALMPLTQLCLPDYRLIEVSGSVDGTIRFFTSAEGALRTAGEVALHEVGLVMSEPNLTIDGLTGRMGLSPDDPGTPELRGYRRDEYDSGWVELANMPEPNITCRRIEFGSIGLRDIRLAVASHWPQIVISGANWRMFNGSGRARGQISFAGPGRCGFTALVNGLSTKAICAAFPGIENYLNGKANASLWLKSEELTLNALKGLTTAWMYSSDDERMAVHRDLLIRLGGSNVRNQLPEHRPYVPLDTGELTTRLEGGKMNFEKLQLDAGTLFLTVKVGVAEGHERIGLLHFLKIINVVSQRGVQVDVDF